MLVWRGHKARVRSLAFSPDGRRIATTAGSSRFVWLWESHTGKKVQKLTEPARYSTDSARCVAFFPDGRLIAATWERGGVTVWDAESGAVVALLTNTGERQYPDTLAISPDGSRLLTTGDGLLDWDFPTRFPPNLARKTHNRTHAKLLRGNPRIGFSPDGTYFCIAEWQMHLYDPVTLEPRRVLSGPGGVSASAFAFTPDDARLVVAFGFSAAVWRVGEWDAKPVRMGRHTNLVRAVGFLPGGGTVLTAAMDGTVRFWDSSTGTETRSFDWGIGKIQAAAVSPDGTLCAAGGDDGHIVVWDVDG